MTLKTILPALAVIAVACGHGSQDNAVPRPVAYPRIEIYDSAYSAVDSLPLHIEANSHALRSVSQGHNGAIWLNMEYPAYRSKLFVTLTPVTDATAAGVIENRTERMSLNSGGNTTEITEITSPGGWNTQLLLTRNGSVTPVQFISVAPKWVVSGSLTLESAVASPDSVAPIVSAVHRDLIHLAKTIE